MRWSLPFAASYLALLANGSPFSVNSAHSAHHLQNSTQHLISRANERDITSLFLIEDGPGSCTGQIDTVNFWLEEARELHSTILRAFQEAPKDKALRVLWYCYFGLGFDDDTLELKADAKKLVGPIEDHLSRVTDFLDNGRLANPQKPDEKPRLFCSGEPFRQESWGSILRDHNGQEVIDEIDTETGYVKYMTLENFFLGQKDQNRAVWWTDKFMGYDFTVRTHPDICPPRDKDGLLLARTSIHNAAWENNDDINRPPVLGESNRHIILCPSVFRDDRGGHDYPSLRQAVSPDNYPVVVLKGEDADINTSIDRLLTISSTLYHELYHLTDNTDTHDLGYSLIKIFEAVVGKKDGKPMPGQRELNCHNPESYVYMAMSAYMYFNKPEGKARALYRGSFAFPASFYTGED
ncbi:hypothetical protein PG985_010249 [Apiospora marii]|uniref:Lysine-specific metallo-endopeptidase domain-containing protein n=1 Tax=Apiospora marii TaxID=335849 RepID=A0ABR1RLC4_9PEZI